MHIAYISYEHPLGIASGGIGTYISHVSKLMAMRSHDVEVFSGSPNATSSVIELDGYKLHLIATQDKATFKTSVLPVFAESHEVLPFDIIESPEFGADGLEIKKAFPALPLSLKLHTPSFLVGKLNSNKITILDKLRFIVGGLIRLQRVKFYWRYNKHNDPEYELFNLAESVVSPSANLSAIVRAEWKSDKEIQVVPNPFIYSNHNFKAVMASPKSNTVITFIGKLEKRKGVLDLMNAIPQILKSFPDTEFVFVGSPSPSPNRHLNMIDYMSEKLSKYRRSLNFLGFQPHHKISAIIEGSDICIFPSLWENFPYVCLEAMAMGKAVIGTNNGGMAEIINDNFNGLLIPPRSPKDIVIAVKKLITNQHLIVSLGNAARETLATRYSADIIGKQTEDVYFNTIAHQ